jgi:hypothetical protein
MKKLANIFTQIKSNMSGGIGQWCKAFGIASLLSVFLFEPSFAIDVLSGVGSGLKTGLGEGSDIQIIIGIASVIIAISVFFFQRNLITALLIVAVPNILLGLFNGGLIGG